MNIGLLIFFFLVACGFIICVAWFGKFLDWIGRFF